MFGFVTKFSRDCDLQDLKNEKNIEIKKLDIEDGKPISCMDTSCRICGISEEKGIGFSCNGELFEKWANSEYQEPSIDWSKVPIDAKCLVRDSRYDWGSNDWVRRYFAGVGKDGSPTFFYGGKTSWSIEGWDTAAKMANTWEYAKLAEEE